MATYKPSTDGTPTRRPETSRPCNNKKPRETHSHSFRTKTANQRRQAHRLNYFLRTGNSKRAYHQTRIICQGSNPPNDHPLKRPQPSHHGAPEPPPTNIPAIPVPPLPPADSDLSYDHLEHLQIFTNHFRKAFSDSTRHSQLTPANWNLWKRNLSYITKRQETLQGINTPVDFVTLFKTLKDIKGDSSPGMDGILGALYKLAIQRFPFDTEPSLFATTLLALINAVLKTAHIPTVEKVAIIHLILKAKEDPKEPAV